MPLATRLFAALAFAVFAQVICLPALAAVEPDVGRPNYVILGILASIGIAIFMLSVFFYILKKGKNRDGLHSPDQPSE